MTTAWPNHLLYKHQAVCAIWVLHTLLHWLMVWAQHLYPCTEAVTKVQSSFTINVVCFLLGNSLVSVFYMPTFWNTVPSSYLPAYEDGTECSKLLAYKIQIQGNYPEENIQHSEHGKSLKSRILHYQVPCRETQVGSFAVSTGQHQRHLLMKKAPNQFIGP